MDTKSKVLLGAFLLTVIAATAWKYDAFVMRHDYLVYDQVSCDPASESCFAYECKEGDEECDDEPFKKIVKNAENIDLCPNYQEGECPTLSCEAGEEECEEILCSEETLEEGEMCAEPVEEEAPMEEDATGAATEEPVEEEETPASEAVVEEEV